MHSDEAQCPTIWFLAIAFFILSEGAESRVNNADNLHSDLKADFILARPVFNIGDSGGENLRRDVRSKFATPRGDNANCAWIQHFIHHLSPWAWPVAPWGMAKLN
jgi:type I restriction enzyme M protein